MQANRKRVHPNGSRARRTARPCHPRTNSPHPSPDAPVLVNHTARHGSAPRRRRGKMPSRGARGEKEGKRGGGGRGESRSWLTPLTTNSVSPTHPRRVRNRPAHATPTAAGRGGGRGGGTPAPAGESVKAPQRHGGSEGAERKESTPTSTWQSPPHPPTTTASDGVCCGEWERGAVGPALSQQRGGGARSRQHANGWPRTSGEFSRPTPPPLFATERRQCRFWRAWPASPLATRSKYGQPPSRMWVWGGGEVLPRHRGPKASGKWLVFHFRGKYHIY